MRTWLADATYAARRLRARPIYTLIAILTLALGIGGTAAIFGIARPVILDPLPYANAKDLGMLWMPGWWTEEEFLYLRGHIPGFQLVEAHRPGDVTMRLANGPLRLIPGLESSWELFDVLGARPLIGRTFHQGDDVQGAEPIAVLSYGLWQELGGSPSILGQRITMNDVPHTVVGVMPKGFWFPDPSVRVWTPKPLDPEGRNGSFALVGHTAPGVDVHHMDAQLHSLATMLGERFHYSIGADKTEHPAVTPLRDQMLGPVRPAIVATFVAMGLILLIACTNVAALMLGQVEGRSSELAVRSALGATRTRITQQLTVEALLLGLVAGIVGAGLASLGFRVLAQALPIGAWADHARFDWTTFIAALVIAILAVLLIALAPAISLWRGDLRGALSGARTGGIQGRGGRMERGLVVGQVALAMLIACGATLLVRSVRNLYAIDPGVDTRGIAVLDIVGNPEMTSRARLTVTDRVLAGLQSIPGVRSAALAMKIPLRGEGDSFGISIDGKPEAEKTFTYFRVVSRDYFTTMGIALRSGRFFDASDRRFTAADTSPVMSVIVNEAFVKKYFPGENPLGRIIGGGFGAPQRIVGVVANVAEANLTDPRKPVRYYLAGQAPTWGGAVTFVMRASGGGDPTTLLDPARRTVQKLAPDFAIQDATTMQRVFDLAVGPARQIMSLLTLLCGLALTLGAVGIYGVISHFATRRKRDWAIRLAIGLPGAIIVRHIVRQGLVLVVLGIAIGAVGTMLLARLLTSFLFGVTATDPLSLVAAALALLAIGAAAALVPAIRAGRVDPAMLLREQ
jgi:putative ABC transport system permease protein